MSPEVSYTIIFSTVLVIAVIGILFSLLIILIIISNRQCHTIRYLLTCDLCITVIIYLILCIARSIYGLRKDWHYYQPACILRAYLGMTTIAAMTYSLLIQAISRLFYVIFYTHRYLLTVRAHGILIILKWLTCCLISIEPFFFERGFTLLRGYRVCGNSLEIPVALYTSVTLSIIPVSLIIIVYTVILSQLRRSARRTRNTSVAYGSSLSSAKRSLKIMQDIILLICIHLFGCVLHLVVTIWDRRQPQSLPEHLLLLSACSITLSATIIIIISFFRDKKLTNIMFKYLCKCHQFS